MSELWDNTSAFWDNKSEPWDNVLWVYIEFYFE